jgi:hypothetical protein
MDGLSRSSSARRRGSGPARAGLVALVAGVCLVAVPGSASGAVKIDPIVDCYVQNSDGSFTVVIGYANPGGARTIPLGTSNRVHPSRLQGVQPTSFLPGTQHGVFSTTVTGAEVAAGARWELDGRVLDYRDVSRTAPGCPASTELPEDGNGTGPAIALAFAGVVGAVAVRRVRRRADAEAAAARAGGDDA